jgi:hypothetical protein
MVNRQKRSAAKRLVEGFAGGTLTSREIDNDFPTDKSDPALAAIWRQLWFLWDDFHTHTLTGRHAPTPDARAMMDRCMAFLESDLEYEWPSLKGASWRLILLRAFGFRKGLPRPKSARLKSSRNSEILKRGRSSGRETAKAAERLKQDNKL